MILLLLLSSLQWIAEGTGKSADLNNKSRGGNTTSTGGNNSKSLSRAGWNPAVHAAENEEYRNKAREMFLHAYRGYLEHAYPYDELRPIR